MNKILPCTFCGCQEIKKTPRHSIIDENNKEWIVCIDDDVAELEAENEDLRLFKKALQSVSRLLQCGMTADEIIKEIGRS